MLPRSRFANAVVTILFASGCVSNTPTIPRIAISPGASERLARFGGPPFERTQAGASKGAPPPVRGEEGADAEGPFVLLTAGTAAFRVRCGSLTPFDVRLGARDGGRLALGPAPVGACRVLRVRPAKTAEATGFEAVFVAPVGRGEGAATTTVRLLGGDRGVLVETLVDGAEGPPIADHLVAAAGRAVTVGRSPLLRGCPANAETATYEATFVVSAATAESTGAAWAITGADGVLTLPCAASEPPAAAGVTSTGARVVVVASYTDEAAAVVELERAAGHDVGTIVVNGGKINEEFRVFERDGTSLLQARLHADEGGRPSLELPVGTFRFGRDAAHARPVTVVAGEVVEIEADAPKRAD